MDRGHTDGRIELVRAAVQGPLSALGLDLEAIELSAAGKRKVLRLAVDQDGGITLDEVAEATKAVSEVLDAGDAMGGEAYTLEVTSRGVDRPLLLPRHWRRNLDRLVEVTPYDGEPITGRIVGWDDEPDGGATLSVEAGEVQIAYGAIKRAMVQVEFNRKGVE